MFLRILSIFLISFAYSQFDWDDNGVPVRQGVHIEWQRTGDDGLDGQMIFAWSDTRFGGRDIYVKKIDSDGNDLWDSEGVPIVVAPGRQEDPILVSDDNGGAYIVWVDYRDEPDYGDIYAQHINSDGEISWGIEGVPLTTVPYKQVSPNMCKDGLGGAFVIWNDLNASTLGYTYGTHLTSNSNTIIAPGTGIPLISSDSQHSGVSIERAASGSAVMVWADDKNLDTSDLDIYGQRITIDDGNLNTVWSTPEEGGIPISDAQGVQEYAKVTYYDEQNSVIVWEDRRNNPNSGDVFGQFVTMSGIILESDLVISDNEAPQIKPRVKASPLGAHVVWEDKRNNVSDIYAQLITVENGVEWSDGGISVCSAVGAQDQPRLTTGPNGGAYYVWMDERYNSFPETEIFLQHFDLNGNPSFDLDGISVSSAEQYQFNPLVRSDGNDGALVVWGDQRSGSIGLYAQHLSTSSGAISFEVDGREYYFGIDGNGLSAKSLYLGSDETLLYWEDKRLGVIADLTYGQKVYSGWENIQEPNGIKLSNNSYQNNPLAEKLGDNVFLGFNRALGDPNVFYQLLDGNLSILGNSDGTAVYESVTPQNSFALNYSSDGYMYIAFSDTRNFIDSDIYIQKYSEDGSAQLGDALIVENFLADDNVNFITDLNSSTLLVGYDTGSFLGTRSYIVGVNTDGTLINDWLDDGDIVGKRLSSDENDQFIQGYAKSNDKVMIVWRDQRFGNADIYAQLLDFNGNLLLDSAGLSVASGANDQQNPSITYNSVEDEFMVCWEDFNGVDFNVFCKTIDNQSLELSEVINLCDDPANQKAPAVYSTLDGSYIFAWEDSRSSVTSDIYYQQLKNGNFEHPQNGVVLCDANFNQKSPQIDMYSETDNKYIIYWDDLRSSGKEDLTNIYVQSVTLSLDDSCDLGDVNGDGILNVIDIVNLVNHVLSIAVLDDLCPADLNADGAIDVIDVVNLVNAILNQ